MPDDGFSVREEDRPILPITARELLDMEITPGRPLLAPWLPEAGIAMLYAPRGIGKTYLAMSAAHAVAAGGALLRWQAPAPRRVLYIDGEMPMAALQSRLAGIAAGAEREPEGDALRFLPADHFRDGLPDFAMPEGMALLDRLTPGVALVVFDNLSTLTGVRENEADDWRPMQSNLLALRRRGVSSLLVHHAGKGGQQRGTSRKEDVLDTVIALKRPDDYDPAEGARFQVVFEKARGFTGADAASFEARMAVGDAGAITWQAADIEAETRSVAEAMFAAGKKAADVVRELGVPKPTAFRWHKEWRERGR